MVMCLLGLLLVFWCWGSSVSCDLATCLLLGLVVVMGLGWGYVGFSGFDFLGYFLTGGVLGVGAASVG